MCIRDSLYINPEENPKEALAFLRERCAGEGIDCEFSVESCAEEDWINNWKQYFHPIPVGEKLLIRPTWDCLLYTSRHQRCYL